MELQIEKLIYGGDGLARQNGKSVFVPFVLPGERVAAEVKEDKKSFARAQVERVLEASPDRVVAPCPYFERCGGCHYQHASYEAQVEFKRGILMESLKRTAGIDLQAMGVPIQVIASAEPFGYRNRTRVHLEHAPRFSLGYYRGGTHELLAVEQCPISSPLINHALQALWDIGNHAGIPRAVREIEIFAEDQDAECLIELYVGDGRPSEGELDRFAQAVQRALPECVGIHGFAPVKAGVMRQIASAGEAALDYHAAGSTYRVSAGSFFQVNRHLLSQFVALVTHGASHGTQGKRALDLYAGAGLFALPLSDSYQEVFAVEASPFSFADLQANLPETAHTYCQTTESFLKQRGEDVLAPDLAIVDPPRAGVGVEGAKLLASTLPLEIRYVSCDPVTLARDLKVLLASGYGIEEVYMVDMFPQTMHVESFVRLRSSRRIGKSDL
ncbi:MAG: class I SAM-dependent RNA methyltransferase [Acidobacteriaceae bacterium]